MTRTRRRTSRLAPAAVALALLLGAAGCGGDDVSADDLRSQLEEGGLTGDQADCAADAIVDDLEPSEVDDVYGADDREEAGDAWDAAAEAIDTCVRENPPG